MHPTVLETHRLTREYLFSLDEGMFISAGNLDCPSRVYGAYHEVVAALSQRERQWEEIVAAQADQRTVAVYKNEADFKTHRALYLKKHSLKAFHYQVPLPFEKAPS